MYSGVVKKNFYKFCEEKGIMYNKSIINKKHGILHSFSSTIKNVKKRLIKVFLLSMAVLLLFCTAACTSAKKAKLNKITPDVKYDYTLFNRDYIVINGTHYDVNDLAYKVSKKKNRTYIYLSTIIDNNLYYLYEYSNTKSLFGTAENNTYKFGVGLFKTNLETTETQLVYDFKNVIPRGLRQYRFPDVLQIINDDTFIFSYNGDLSVFDVKTQAIKETLKFYDKDVFRNIEYGDICFKRNGDCYYHLKDGNLRYAEFKNGHYIDRSFKVDKESSYVARFENYIYTYTYIGGFGEPYKYLNCYDLETEEEKDHEFLMEIVEKEKQREEQEKDQQKDITDKESITVGDKIYYYTHNENQVVITDEKGDTIYEINSKYASLNNSKFVKLFGVYFNYTDVAYADVSEVKIFDNRMFISFTHNIMMWGSTPQMIFEFDIESGNLYYLTYMSGSSFYFYNINGNPI